MISLVLPFFDEEEVAGTVAREHREAFDAAGLALELILVDNGSQDGTRAALAATGERLVALDHNRGYGGGIRAGLKVATGDVLGWSWGDGQVPAAVAVEVARALEGADLAKATRARRGDPLGRRLQSRAYNAIMGGIFGLSSEDVNGCPKLLTRAALEALDLRSEDWFLDPEALLKAAERGLRVVEVEAESRPRRGGKSKVKLGTALEFARRLAAWRRGWRP